MQNPFRYCNKALPCAGYSFGSLYGEHILVICRPQRHPVAVRRAEYAQRSEIEDRIFRAIAERGRDKVGPLGRSPLPVDFGFDYYRTSPRDLFFRKV